MYDPADGLLVGLAFVLPNGIGAVMVDGFAAGEAWFQFKALSGPHEGETFWCTYDYDRGVFRYEARTVEDDCEWFNSEGTQHEGMGGCVIPEWDGMEFAVVELF